MSEDDDRLLVWAGRDVAALRAAWRVPGLIALRRTASTNDVARRLAAEGATSLTCVLAEEQTAGRGRLGRVWTAPAGSSLLVSFVLRPPGGQDPAPSTIPLRVGMAAATAIEQTVDIPVRLKWPNDLLDGAGRKLGGVLCEASTAGTGSVVIAGIGINVRQESADWTDELRGEAVSLREGCGHDVDRAALAGALVRALRTELLRIDRALSEPERATWNARDALRGTSVTVDGDTTGIVDGVSEDGALRLRTSRGVRLFHSGTVRPASAAPSVQGGRS